MAHGLVEERNVRTDLGSKAFLLCDIELGRGTGLEPLLDQVENPVGGVEILARDPQPVLRREHLEIGVANCGDGGQNDDFLVEAAGDRGLLRGSGRSTILAPEINFVAGVERGMEKVPLGRPGVLKTLRKTDEIDRWQEWRAGDLGLRVGLQDASDGCPDVEIGELGFLDKIGEFARAKAAPPIECRRGGIPSPSAVSRRDLRRKIRPLGAQYAPGQHLHER